MTVFKLVLIDCDWPGCLAKYARGDIDLVRARKSAVNEGWTNFRGLIDLCGPPDRAPAWRTDERRELGNHAEAGHHPKLASAGKSLISVACSCGWTDQTGWLPARGAVRYRWASHVKEATEPPAAEPSPSTEVPVG